ncbi:MAG: hypothetical protein V4850_31040 [Myxococcota bacterium]
MDGSRKLTLALGLVAVVSTVTAVTLALRPGGSEADARLPAPPAPAELVPTEPHTPGGPNAIAAKALAEGGPRAPTVGSSAGAPRRSVTNFRTAFDASAPGTEWDCVAAAGAHAAGRLDAGGTEDGGADPTVAAACSGGGPDTLEGFVRVATMPQAGTSACEVTVSYTVTRGATKSPGKDLRGARVPGGAPDSCLASLAGVRDTLAERIAAP